VWLTEYLLPAHTGLFIAFQIASMVLGLALGFGAGYRSTIVALPDNADTPENKHTRIIVSCVLTFFVVGGVVALGASTESMLVGIIGELPIISIITTCWVYTASDDAAFARKVRSWTHSIQARLPLYMPT
jgi:hypothetical protein